MWGKIPDTRDHRACVYAHVHRRCQHCQCHSSCLAVRRRRRVGKYAHGRKYALKAVTSQVETSSVQIHTPTYLRGDSFTHLAFQGEVAVCFYTTDGVKNSVPAITKPQFTPQIGLYKSACYDVREREERRGWNGEVSLGIAGVIINLLSLSPPFISLHQVKTMRYPLEQPNSGRERERERETQYILCSNCINSSGAETVLQHRGEQSSHMRVSV